MKKQDFPGFPKESSLFFKKLAKNNNREWFNAHKEDYEQHVVGPMMEFIVAMGWRLTKLSPHFIADTRRQGGSMFRIYRDVRFAKDKKPYKEHMACQFRHEAGKDAHAPGFYLHIAPHEVFVGAGMWRPANPVLAQVRDRIIERPQEWKKVIQYKPFKALCGELGGESLKRPPRGYEAEHPFIDDLKRKSFIATRHFEPEQIYQSDFIKEVEVTFKALKPLMKFLCDALDLPC